MSDDHDDSYGTFDLTSSHGSAPPWGWDYVLVFRAPKEASPSPSISASSSSDAALLAADTVRVAVLSSLRAAGFSYSQLWLPSDAIVLVRLALPEPTMLAKAEAHALKLRLLPRYGGGYLAFEHDRAHVFVNELRRAKGLPYFAPADRVLLTVATIRSREDWGAGLNIGTLKRQGKILQAFPLHTSPERETLLSQFVYKNWWNPRLIMPLDMLEEYFGSRVTIYFAWLAFYARMLLGLAALSVPVYAVLHYTDSPNVDAWTRLVWGLGLCFWATYWLEYWKRRNAVLNVKWGLDRFYEENENEIRPDFQGENTQGFYCRGGFVNLEDLDPSAAAAAAQPGLWDRLRSQLLRTAGADTEEEEESAEDVLRIGGGDDADFVLEAPITGLTFSDLPVFPYSSKKQLQNRSYVSSLIALFFALCVAALSFLILFFKTEIIALFGADFGKYVPGIATALLISVSDTLWKGASLKLTKWENHRTAQTYEDSLITKRFAFQFVSNYISLFYIALVKPFTPADPCTLGSSGIPDCMAELETQMTSLVITKATIQQLMEVGLPSITFRVKLWLQRREQRQLVEEIDDQQRMHLLAAGATIDDADRRRSVEESHMAPYASTIGEYGELVIQHGFLVLFGLAFPLAALINFLNNIIECRTDTYKMLAVQQRPDADDAADIGGWLQALRFLSTASVITTAALVTITTPALQRALPDVIGDVAERYPAVCFLIFEHVLLFIRWGVNSLVSDRPASTYRMLARQEFLIAKCFSVGWKPYYESKTSDSKSHVA